MVARIRDIFHRAKDLTQIRNVLTRYMAALDACDLETALSCHADVHEISAVSLDSVYWGRDEVRAFLKNLFRPEVRELTRLHPHTVRLHIQGDTAMIVADHLMRLRRPREEHLPARVTFTMIRQPHGWRILNSHLSAPRNHFEDPGDAGH